MPTQWHKIHSTKELQDYATRVNNGPDARCPLCTMIWKQSTKSASTNPVDTVVGEHPNVSVRLFVVENFRQPANNMLYQTQNDI